MSKDEVILGFSASAKSKTLSKQVRRALSSIMSVGNSVSNLLPDARERLEKMIADIQQRCHPPESYLVQIGYNLPEILDKYGPAVTAQVIEFVNEYGFPLFYGSLSTNAELLSQGKRAAITQALYLQEKYKIWDSNFCVMVEGVEMQGLEDLERGADIPPRPGDIAEPPVLQEYWDPDIAWLRRKGEYVLIVAQIGYARTAQYHELLTSKGTSPKQIESLLREIAFNWRQHHDNRGEVRVQTAIRLIERAQLPAGDFVWETQHVLERKSGTVAEVGEILALIKENEIPNIMAQDFELALDKWCQPGKREQVRKLFAAKWPNGLAFGRIKTGLEIGFAWAFGGGDELLLALDRYYERDINIEARLRTQELLARFYSRYGIFSWQQEMVADWGDNPLIVSELLDNKRMFRSLDEVRVDLERQYGTEEVSAILRRFGEPESETLVALMNAHPQELIRLIDQNGPDCKIAILRTIGRYGLSNTLRALSIVAKSSLDPSLALLPVTQALEDPGDKLTFIRMYSRPKIIGPEDERQLCGFLSLPIDIRAIMARAVRQYRKVHRICWNRISRAYPVLA